MPACLIDHWPNLNFVEIYPRDHRGLALRSFSAKHGSFNFIRLHNIIFNSAGKPVFSFQGRISDFGGPLSLLSMGIRIDCWCSVFTKQSRQSIGKMNNANNE